LKKGIDVNVTLAYTEKSKHVMELSSQPHYMFGEVPAPNKMGKSEAIP
jgi:hypothetical protein